MAKKTIAGLSLEVETLRSELEAFRRCSTHPELVDELVALKASLEEKNGEILELRAENEEQAHRLADLEEAEQLWPDLDAAVAVAGHGLERTILGPVRSIAAVVEAMRHGHIKLVKA